MDAVRRAYATAHRLWSKIHEPRVVSVVYFSLYLVLIAVGMYSVANPPSSIAGEVGRQAMYALASLLALGGTLGAVAALPGYWWLERLACVAIGSSGLLYLWVILTLHFTQPGNRMLQAGFVYAVTAHQIIRWVRVKERPYRPLNPLPTEV